MEDEVDIVFEHSFSVEADQADVLEFHLNPKNMSKLTPPVAFVSYERVPERVSNGESVAFRMMMGPVPVRWVAEFSDVDERGFVDAQTDGPFEKWEHRHQFVQRDGYTEVIDRIEIKYKPSGKDRWIGKMMAGTLDGLFIYRKMQTRRHLSTT